MRVIITSVILTALLTSSSSFAEDNADDQGAVDEIIEGTRSLEAQNIRLQDMKCDGTYADKELLVWSIRYGSYSGWTSLHGVRIWSDGQAAMCTNRACSEYSVCSSLRVRPEMLDLIGEKISQMPACKPEPVTIRMPAQCFDHEENYIQVEVGNERIAFSYAMAKSCRKEDVPAWMAEITELMRKHIDWIRRCEIDE